MKSYSTPNKLPKFGSINTVLQLLGRDKDVLDVGCSEGYLGRYDAGRNRFWGVDYNQEAVTLAKREYRDTKCVDLNRYDGETFFDKTFDVVVFADVLEHVLDPERLLKMGIKQLNDGGLVVISLPNVALWRVRLNLLFGRFDYAKYGVLDDTHLHLYTFASAQRLAAKCGLRVRRLMGSANELGLIARFVRPLRNLASINVVLVCEKT